MIKITFKQEPYHYEHTGGQPYDIETVVTLNEDISSDEAIIAFMRVLNIATYHATLKTLKDLVADLEYEYKDNDRIM
jgi:hypothetical protein